jgi:hypothetical protein
VGCGSFGATKRTLASPPVASCDMASSLVLLGVPCERHIPYFARPVPSSRESYAQRLDIETDLSGSWDDAAPLG